MAQGRDEWRQLLGKARPTSEYSDNEDIIKYRLTAWLDNIRRLNFEISFLIDLQGNKF